METVELRVDAVTDGSEGERSRPAAGSSEGASYGAAQGASGAVIVGAKFGCHPMWNAFIIFTCPLGFLAGAVAAVPTAAVGAAVGAGKAKDEALVSKSNRNFDEVVAEKEPSKELRQQLVQEIEARTSARVIPVNETQSDAAQIDVEIEMDFQLLGRLDPDLAATANVKGYIRPSKGQSAAYERTWHYRDEIGNYFELTANKGKPLRDALDDLFSRIAKQMVTDFYVSGEEVSREDPKSNSAHLVTVDAAGGRNSLASTSNVAQPEPVGWEGGWSGSGDGVEISFQVNDGKITNGSARAPGWTAAIFGEVESGGAIRGRASVKYNWGGHRTMDIAGSMPIVRYNDTDGNFGEITISRR